VIRDMIIPNCVWVAGRTAAAVRKAAVACLWAFIRTPTLLTTDQVHRRFEFMRLIITTTLGTVKTWIGDWVNHLGM